jgi:two-component system, NtrC family, sensor kinase
MIGERSAVELQQQNAELQRQLEQVKLAEAEAQRRLEELQLIFDASPIMFWYKDRSNRTLRVNQAAAALEGLPVAAIEGRSCYEMYPQEQAEAFYKDDLEVINSGQPKLGIIEQHRSPKGGHDLWLQTGKVPLHDKKDAIIGVVAFAVDISEQKRAEETAVEAQEKLSVQNRQFNRVHTFLRSTLTQLSDSVDHGADRAELTTYLRNAQRELDRIEQGV